MARLEIRGLRVAALRNGSKFWLTFVPLIRSIPFVSVIPMYDDISKGEDKLEYNVRP